MKDPFDRTKVVLRHLPPSISQQALMEQIDGRFAGRYKWFTFRPGKTSQKNQWYSRAYIDFKKPEDVVEFAEFFNGHVFVNEKGTQLKAFVEYAPSQRVPKALFKKDGREGTINKDPEYLEFLEVLAKPVENLPSAEIQLERKEAERASGTKETIVVTPLMDYIRQKRAAKNQRSPANGKLSRRAAGVSPSSSSSSKRGSDKRRVPTPMYVLRDSGKNSGGKDKAGYIIVSRREEQQATDKSVAVTSASGTEATDEEAVSRLDGSTSLLSGGVETGKRRVILLKGKEREGQQPSSGLSQQQTVTVVRNMPGSSKQSQRHEGSGRIIRSILSNKDTRGSQTENMEKDKRPPRPPNSRMSPKDHIPSNSPLSSAADGDGKRSLDDKVAGIDQHGSISYTEKQDRRMRNKDKPDRGVWRSHATDETISSSSAIAPTISDSLEGLSISQQAAGIKVGDADVGVQPARVGRGSNALSGYDMASPNPGEMKHDSSNAVRNAEIKSYGGGRLGHSPVENGVQRPLGRRGLAQGLKEVDGSLSISEGKPSKRGGPSGYGSHERQVWVQKAGSGS